jgi:hypothetical protein
MVKKDQEILKKYLNGESITKALQTPIKDVRGYTTPTKILFIATKRASERASILVTLTALQKGFKVSQFTEGNYLICLLTP